MMKKRLMACLIIGCLVIGSAIPVSAEESTDVIETTEQDLSSEEETESAEIKQRITEEAEQDVTVDENADVEENKDNAEQEEVYTEITDSVYIEGGNAEDSVSGIQTYSDKVFEGLFYLQLDELAYDMNDKMSRYFYETVNADTLTFEVNGEYGLEFTVQDGNSAALEQAKENIKAEISYAASSALGAFLYDYPQAFWIRGMEFEWVIAGRASGGTVHYSVTEITLTPDPSMSQYDVATVSNNFYNGMREAINVISEQIDINDSIYEKAKKIHDWINAQVTYDYDAASIGGDEYAYAHTAYPVFADDKGKKVVCEGYAKAYKILCNHFEIGCTLVSGTSYTDSGAGAHMWNMVQMPDEKWYGVDLTWDDSGDKGYDTYFMVGANTQGFNGTFANEHVMDTRIVAGGMDFAFPALADDAYVPSGNEGGSGVHDQDNYTIKYEPGAMVNIPTSVFEKVTGDPVAANRITVNIPDLGVTLEGIFWMSNFQIKIPYDVDVKAGVYDTSVVLRQTSPGWEEEWTDTQILKVKVEEDMQGVHYVNSFAETDGTKDAVFKFKNGTGANRIVSIDEIKFAAVNGPGPDDAYSGFTKTEDFEYDLDKGTVTIPKEWFTYVKEEFGMSFLPYVYFGEMTFTLESGGQVTADLSDMPQEVPIDEFENPGDDAWYFIYREPEPGELMKGDITGDGIVDGGDLLYMLRVVSKRVDLSDLSTAQIDAGDVVINPGDSQGLIDGSDLLQLLRYVSKRIDSLE